MTTHVVALLFGAATVGSALVTYLLGLETVLLWRGLHPITWYTRNAVSWHHGLAVLTVAGVSVLLGAGVTHFVLDR